ncbi:hypothetical protein [Micrococcus luteus]|uniref:hypothetical protein n=1 Tax=Micrococcus luteus TaxID=1270 RepID=UPI001182C1C3|nr:hypothetical protein [Micrococcus luteus]
MAVVHLVTALRTHRPQLELPQVHANPHPGRPCATALVARALVPGRPAGAGPDYEPLEAADPR